MGRALEVVKGRGRRGACDGDGSRGHKEEAKLCENSVVGSVVVVVAGVEDEEDGVEDDQRQRAPDADSPPSLSPALNPPVFTAFTMPITASTPFSLPDPRTLQNSRSD